MRHLHTLLIAAAFSLATTGCSTVNYRLMAADGGHRMVAIDAAHEISVVVTTEAWDENGNEEPLTIIHVLISNMGQQPVLLAPGDFDLFDGRGFRYRLRDAGATFKTVPPGTPLHGAANLNYDPGNGADFEPIHSRSEALRRLALPWGVLQPGTQMRGFLYFDNIGQTANHAMLAWRSQTPDHRSISEFGFRLYLAPPPY